MVERILTTFVTGFGFAPNSPSVLAAMNASANGYEAHEIADLLVSFVGQCGASERNCIYLSTPMTSGRRYLGQTADRSAELFALNCQHARQVAQSLRMSNESVVVIDPTWLEQVPGWNQSDYHSLWSQVIERYARRIIFINDWQYSVGCSIEFAVATRLQLPRIDQNSSPISRSVGRKLISRAAAEIRSHNGDSDVNAEKLDEIAAKLA